MKRRGVTLVEFLVVIFIIGLVFSLLLGGIVLVRKKSNFLQCQNNIRQIIVGHTMCFSQSEIFYYKGYENIPVMPPHFKMFDLLGYKIEYPSQLSTKVVYPNVPFMRCPSDPTLMSLAVDGQVKEYTSYPYNAYVYKQGSLFPSSILDGTSNTVAFSERYGLLPRSRYLWTVCSVIPGEVVERPATFADLRFGDNTPVNDPESNLCLGSVTGETFFNCPEIKTAKKGELASGHEGAINMGFLDGSVRSFTRGIAPGVFWAQVTPAAAD